MTRTGTAAAAVLALALAAPAQARIELGRGIDGVHLKDSLRTVKAKLGKPSFEQKRAGITFLRYDRRQVFVHVGPHGVQDISTTSKRERTSSGVGPGSTRSAVKSRVPHVTCSSRFVMPGSEPDCRATTGHARTDFIFQGGPRVITVIVKRV